MFTKCSMLCFLLGLTTTRPSCNQLYNIFYSSHPSAMRIEPLLHPSFKHIMPVKIPRYQKYPYGDSAPMYARMLHSVELQCASRKKTNCATFILYNKFGKCFYRNNIFCVLAR